MRVAITGTLIMAMPWLELWAKEALPKYESAIDFNCFVIMAVGILIFVWDVAHLCMEAERNE
jgi:hypothetical protein